MLMLHRSGTTATLLLLALAPGCSLGQSEDGPPEEWFGATDTTPATGTDDDGPDETAETAEPAEPGACHEYGPGEAGGLDYTPRLTEAELAALDLRIDYPDAPIAALAASASHLGGPGLLRATFTGLMEIDHADPSTALELHDVPLAGLGPQSFTVALDGQATPVDRVTCTSDPDTPITVIFAVDVTGSMSPVIDAVRASLVDFVDAAVGLGLHGRIGVVTYQDTVGVNIPFEDCDGVHDPMPERSPFFAPVPLDDAAQVDALRGFVGSLHADGGTDWPENLAAAVDFATHNVIGYTADGSPNVIGEGDDDPPFTEPWPLDQLEGLVVVIAITDATFHPPETDSPSLLPEFRPRSLPAILNELGSTIVATIDPALQNGATELDGDPLVLDADLWPRYTGGFGRDWLAVELPPLQESISVFDLELLLLGQGLLELPLAPALASTCVLELDTEVAPSSMQVTIDHEAGSVQYTLSPEQVGP